MASTEGGTPSQSGSDGTRTRDLRRDGPVMALAGEAGRGGDSRPEQAFPTLALRGLPGLGGYFRRTLRDVRGMDSLPEPQTAGCLRDEGGRLGPSACERCPPRAR